MTNRNYWLVKSEPTAYSWDDLLSEEDQTAEWDGVRNYQARNILRDQTESGDPGFCQQTGSKAEVPEADQMKGWNAAEQTNSPKFSYNTQHKPEILV